MDSRCPTHPNMALPNRLGWVGCTAATVMNDTHAKSHKSLSTGIVGLYSTRLQLQGSTSLATAGMMNQWPSWGTPFQSISKLFPTPHPPTNSNEPGTSPATPSSTRCGALPSDDSTTVKGTPSPWSLRDSKGHLDRQRKHRRCSFSC